MTPPAPSPRGSQGLVAAMLSLGWTRAALYFVLVGALLLGPAVAGLHMWQAKQAESYVEVTGTVATSRLDTRGDKALPVIVVAYEYAGQRLRMSLTPARGIEGAEDLEADEIVARYPVGSSIPVFVDPEAPEQAALSRRYDPGALIGATVLVAMLLAFVIWTDLRRRAAGPHPG